jgi:hypothetical protein
VSLAVVGRWCVYLLSTIRCDIHPYPSQRCDGVRPSCGPCDRLHRADDCDYADSSGRSRTSALEEDIRRLEERIYELEHPGKALTTSVTLHHPYRQADADTPHLVGKCASSLFIVCSGNDTLQRTPFL